MSCSFDVIRNVTDLPVAPREIRRIYARLVEDIAAREQGLRGDLPVEAVAEIHTDLQEVVDNWEHRRKSLRTVPACNVYTRECKQSVGTPIRRTLTSLDAIVNVLDDIIDTRELSEELRIGLTVNAAFSAVLMAESCPDSLRAEAGDLLREYFTALFQVPLVERELFETMTEATNPQKRRDIAERIYAYRARDVDAFARLPSVVLGVSQETEQRLLSDLRAYRARRLLFKDISDVERDLSDGDITPLIHLLRTHETTANVVDAIEDLRSRFDYSDAGRRRYGDVLDELEAPPPDLASVLRSMREVVATSTE